MRAASAIPGPKSEPSPVRGTIAPTLIGSVVVWLPGPHPLKRMTPNRAVTTAIALILIRLPPTHALKPLLVIGKLWNRRIDMSNMSLAASYIEFELIEDRFQIGCSLFRAWITSAPVRAIRPYV